MNGYVQNLRALLSVIFRLPAQPDISIEFVADTGFSCELTLPPGAVAALGLPFAYDQAITLANDSDVEVPVHKATILWHGVERTVNVFATGNRPLLGTALLAGSEFLAQFAESGLVTVDEL